MKCSTCQTVNPAQARFCMGCGSSFVQGLVCRSCLSVLPGNARFCYNCGAMAVVPDVRQQTAVSPIHLAQPIAQEIPVAPIVETPLETAVVDAQPDLVPPETTAPEPKPEPKAKAAAAEPSPFDLPAPRPIEEMQDSLKKYLPEAIYETLERRITPESLTKAKEHMTAVLSTAKTYLPQTVVLAPQPPGVPTGGMFKGTFLFVDVSGFTPLNEQLSKYPDGAERVTKIINDLFLQLVQTLFDHGGVLLKFGGDALLGLFQGATNDELALGALRACQAAMVMQEIMEQFKQIPIDDEGGTQALLIKCGISHGEYFAAHLGTKENMGFVTTGNTVNQAEQAEGHAVPGDVIITEAMLAVVGDNVETEPRDENHHLLKSVTPSKEVLKYSPIAEPPAGDLEAQVTYLVNRLDRLVPYLASELLPRLVNAPDPANVIIMPERRPVTVMFANYVGIGKLIDDMGQSNPELITERLNSYFVKMAEIVEEYEGTLARMDQYSKGDRLVIFFGAPRAHEDDPMRACKTALRMQKEVKKYFGNLQTPKGIYNFRQRIGINSGFLFAGNAGAPNLRQEYTLMGDDINTAARMMSIADLRKQDVFITKKTQTQVAQQFDLTDLGEKQVKGKTIRIHTFRLEGELKEVRAQDETNLIGREKEMKMLHACADGLMSGRGEILSLMGESGRGKSRLKREFKAEFFKAHNPDDVQWIDARALSFTQKAPYWLAREIFKKAIDNTEPEYIASELYEACTDLLGEETAREAVPFLAKLFNLTIELGEWSQWVEDLAPHVRQKQTLWAAREFFTAYAQQKPTAIVLDDLHWADESSLALLEDLLAVTDQAPLAFFLLFRPIRESGVWKLRNKAESAYPHRYKEITLDPLTEKDSLALLSALLPGAQFSEQAETEILNKSAGNPFYIEAVVQALKDSTAVAHDSENKNKEKIKWVVTDKISEIAIPDSLQGAIVARIDRLTEDARHALQIASVIGSDFKGDIFRSLDDQVRAVDSWLAQLERKGLIQAQARADDYAFADNLVREVAYESLLVQSRRELHRKIGDALEAHAEEPEKESDALAEHYSKSDATEKAIKYLRLAAETSEANSANETAVEQYGLLLELYILTGRSWQEQFDILSRRQKLFNTLTRQEERAADLREMLALATENRDKNSVADAWIGLAELNQYEHHYDKSQELAEKALKIKTELKDSKGIAACNYQLGVLSYMRGDYEAAQPALASAQAMQQASNDKEGEGWSAMYQGMIQFMEGRYSDALHYHTLAMKLAKERGDWFQQGIHLTNLARVEVRLGRYAEALENFGQSQKLRDRVGDVRGQGFSYFGLAQVRTYIGALEKAAEDYHTSLELRKQFNDERGIGHSYNGLGVIALAQEQYEEAAERFQAAYDIHQRLGNKAETIIDLSNLAQAQLGLGDLDTAKQTSTKAMQLLEEQKSVEEVQQIYFNHYLVMKACEDETAVSWLQKANAAIEEQAESIADANLRDDFLANVPINQEIAAALLAGA